MLTKCHSNINWVDLARQIGRPFEIDPWFPLHLYRFYHYCVAPVVELWRWELSVELAKRSVQQQFNTTVLDPTFRGRPSPVYVYQP